MPDNVDEDLIEATIRRVAEAQAAREDETQAQAESPETPGAEVLDEATPAADGPDEDLIAATIRRVQAQQQAAADEAAAEEPDVTSPAREITTPQPAHDAEGAGPDEDAIAATILRVQQQQAAREAATAPEATVAIAPDAEPNGHYEPTSFPAAEFSDGVGAGIEQQLQAAWEAIDRLTGRVEALERAALRSASAQAAATSVGALRHDGAEIAQPSFGAPQRPSIVRDLNATRTALAEQLPEPGVIDTRPLPKPLPPIHADSRRGLDLLPRTYRITVEDKRRGVDLVPLHRALLSMDGVKDMSLLSYNNGVAIVALETTNDLNQDDLGKVVSRAMSRGAKVEQHNEHTFVVKLAED
jgi:hypothetical protein